MSKVTIVISGRDQQRAHLLCDCNRSFSMLITCLSFSKEVHTTLWFFIMTRNRSWLKFKHYTHFTKKLSHKDISFIIGYVRNKEAVAKHKFYPLIHKKIRARRYKYNAITDEKCHVYLNELGEKKSNEKVRKIYYATHIDAMIYSYYANEILGKKYEAILGQNQNLSESIVAYRRIKKEGEKRNKNNIDFAYDIFKDIDKRIRTDKECVAVALDIKEFFDSLDHKLLKKAWLELVNHNDVHHDILPKDHFAIFKSLTNFSYVNLKDVLKEYDISHAKELTRKNIDSFCTSYKELRERIVKKGYLKKHPFENKNEGVKKGIPQGTPISAFLANAYLLNFDKEVIQLVKQVGGLYRRYSDDLVILCSKKDLNMIVTAVCDKIKNDYKLEIHKSKTQSSHFKLTKSGSVICSSIEENKPKPFQYLGFEYDGNRTLIKSASLAKYYRSMKRLVKTKARRAKIDLEKNYHKRHLKQVGLINRGPIYKRFSHLGKRGRKRNYIIYANDASKIMKDEAIRKQMQKSWLKLNKYIFEIEKKYNLPTKSKNRF